MARSDPHAILQGLDLTTAEIIYRLPDAPSILQTFVWQDYDLHPLFPKLQNFLLFWTEHLEGKLFKVRVAHRALITPREMRVLSSDKYLYH